MNAVVVVHVVGIAIGLRGEEKILVKSGRWGLKRRQQGVNEVTEMQLRSLKSVFWVLWLLGRFFQELRMLRFEDSVGGNSGAGSVVGLVGGELSACGLVEFVLRSFHEGE